MKKILSIIAPLLLFCNLAFSIETKIYECQNDYKFSYKKSNPPKIKFGKNLNDKSEFIAETRGPLTNWVWARGNENGGEIFYNTFNKNINRLYFEMADLSKGDFKKILDTPKEGVEITQNDLKWWIWIKKNEKGKTKKLGFIECKLAKTISD